MPQLTDFLVGAADGRRLAGPDYNEHVASAACATLTTAIYLKPRRRAISSRLSSHQPPRIHPNASAIAPKIISSVMERPPRRHRGVPAAATDD